MKIYTEISEKDLLLEIESAQISLYLLLYELTNSIPFSDWKVCHLKNDKGYSLSKKTISRLLWRIMFLLFIKSASWQKTSCKLIVALETMQNQICNFCTASKPFFQWVEHNSISIFCCYTTYFVYFLYAGDII